MRKFTFLLLYFLIASFSFAENHGNSQQRNQKRSKAPQVPQLSGVSYSFEYMEENPSEDSIKMQLNIDNTLVKEGVPLFAHVTVADLSDSLNPKQIIVPVQYKKPTAHLDITGLDPAKVYKIEHIDIFEGTSKLAEDSEFNFLGRVTLNLFAPTDGPKPLDKARRKIALKAINEAIDWRDTPGMHYSQRPYSKRGKDWCGDFYRYAAHEHVKIDYQHRWNEMGFFSKYGKQVPTSQLSRLDQNDAVHGDYLGLNKMGGGGHRAVILGVDAKRGIIFTAEGNVNNKVLFMERKLNELPWVGHLTDGMVGPLSTTDLSK